ncbi:MAG TPA: type I DNA topoisomerase [Candidatus Saccharimonadales bacterium]|nr:type I DNA topoisomerase [Candidatus Saccharimonadales bacterium]
MKLVIVESPTKAKTISKFLGKEYVIRASMGHVMDLPKSKLGVDVENDFTPQYEVVADRKKIIAELKRDAKTADSIILATDPDREGEAISANIKDVLTIKPGKKSDAKFSRVVFHEITSDAIAEAFQHPRDIDKPLVDAQTARRILDRLVGYKLSPLLWQKIRRGLSAGRVQSIALRLIVEREKEIKAFAKEEYWTMTCILKKEMVASAEALANQAEFELIEINKKKIESSQKFNLYNGDYTVSKTSIANEEQAQEIKKDLEIKQFIVADVIKKETKRSPQMPFTTSTLQQEASRRFGYAGKRTMSLAQKLYEEGFITYHRTDSVNMAEKAVSQIRGYVKKQFGEKYIPPVPRVYKTKQKLAQEAHEAIRPTNISLSEKEIVDRIGPQYAKLYDLIWRRTVASQMSDALIESTTVYVDAKNNTENTYRFKTNGSVLRFEGFLKINPFGLQDKRLPQFTVQEQLMLTQVNPIQHETPPPPRYNDASLIGSLEDEGIGRPSTYASIISVIETRNYIERDQGRFVPTPVGVAVNDFLVQHFSNIDDIPFTAHIEDELDAIAQGDKQWIPVIKEFYEPFEKTILSVKNAERVKIAVEATDEICPKCGAPLVVRVGKFGKFFSCSNFPTCDFKKTFVETTNFACPKCKEGKVIVKKTKKGRKFYGCSRYPNCDFAVWKLKDVENVPEGTKET